MAYKARWEGLFNVFDADKSGSIDDGDTDAYVKGFEALGPMTPESLAKLKQAVQSMLFSIIECADLDGDGKVTQEEWITTVENQFIGKSEDAAPEWWKKYIEIEFKTLDQNNDGEISENEFVTMAANSRPSIPADTIRTAYKVFKGNAEKLDIVAYNNAAWRWATSPNPEPEMDVLTSLVI